MAKKKVDKKMTKKAKTKGTKRAKAKTKANNRPVKLSKLTPSPIQHVHLPDQLLKQITAVYKVLGPYLDTTLEQFEIGFMRDMHPVREIAIWTRITTAWRTYHQKFLKDTLQSKEVEKKIVGALVALSTGIADSLTLGVPTDVARKLSDCYAHANDLDSKHTKRRGR